MNIFTKLFKKQEQDNVGGMEDYMTLIRVYFQCVIASNTGISNLGQLPDLAMFKRSLHVPTANNRLGAGEKNVCKKMLQDLYGISDNFFKEIDSSIRKGCRTQREVTPYLIQFQGFTQELMMLVSNEMKWKFRIPNFLKGALRTMIEKTIHDILTKVNWKDEAERKSAFAVRRYQQTLGFTEPWMSEFVFNVITLAKKERKPSQEELDKAENKLKK